MKPAIWPNDFLIVCVGGSAGGLDAYSRLLAHLPADMGVAIVIVNHLRHVATLLHEILPRYTSMPVELITEGMVIRPNHVFIIPEKHDLHVLDGQFRLKPISKPHDWPDVITVFLRSLTQFQLALRPRPTRPQNGRLGDTWLSQILGNARVNSYFSKQLSADYQEGASKGPRFLMSGPKRLWLPSRA